MAHKTKFEQTINRQRTAPRLWDYSYILLRNNTRVFKQFHTHILQEQKKSILDVGCGFKPWECMFVHDKAISYVGVDVDKERSSADFVANSDNLPFADNAFDALIYSEVLEHGENLQGTLREMRRVAKTGSLVFISSPFVFPEHGIPNDYQRLTRYFFQKTFAEDDIILIRESNSSWSTSIVAVNLFLETTPFNNLVGFKHVIYAATNTIGIVCDGLTILLMKLTGNRLRNAFYAMPLGYALIVKIRK
jgi:SAM-dependent methyltransferase